MDKNLIDNSTLGRQFDDVTGRVTGHKAGDQRNSLFHDLKASRGNSNTCLADSKSSDADADHSAAHVVRPMDSLEKTGDHSGQEKYKFDLRTSSTRTEDGKVHTVGEIIVEQSRKPRSNAALRKAKSRAKCRDDGWQRVELKMREDLVEPIHTIGDALNAASLRGDRLYERLISVAKDMGY